MPDELRNQLRQERQSHGYGRESGIVPHSLT
jgi:hypothetical protein